MAENLMAVAYENGVNLFDTAEVYASGRCGFVSTSSSKLKPTHYRLSKAQLFLSAIGRFCVSCVISIVLQPVKLNVASLHRAEITLGNIIKKKAWR